MWRNRLFKILAVFLVGYSLFSIIYLRLSQDNTIELHQLLQDFITIFLGITVEALPFVIIGVTVSTLVDAYVDSVWLLKRMPKNRFLSHIFVATFGTVMPVCECGNVPVARRLLLQGFTVSQTIVFLMSSPVVNIITFWSTWEAFSFEPIVPIVRILAVFIISIVIGLIVSYLPNQDRFVAEEVKEGKMAHEHEHHSKWEHMLETFVTEFYTTFKLLLVGAAIAATTQTIVPRSLIEGIGSSPVLSIVAMLVLAFVVSICANIDAFFALAYAQTFTVGSIVSFLVFGPMVDMKILSMLRSTFTPRLLVIVSSLALIGAAITGLIVNLLR